MVSAEEILDEIKYLFERNQDTGHRFRKFHAHNWRSQFYDMSWEGFQLGVVQIERYTHNRIQYGAILKWDNEKGVDNLTIDLAICGKGDEFESTLSMRFSNRDNHRKGILAAIVDEKCQLKYGWDEVVDFLRDFSNSIPTTERR